MALSPAEEDVLARFRARLVDLFGPRLGRVVLFGSRARGEGHEDSDLDVLVTIRSLVPADRRDVLDIAFDLELDARIVLSPLVREHASWSFDSPLGREIARDGIPA
jgi:predicted nucleotidyltransferase